VNGINPFTDYTTQYQYRNSIFGINHIDTPSGMVSIYLYFIFTVNSPSNLLLGLGFNHRIRTCSVALPYYYYKTQLCYDICPDYNYANTTFKFCIDCHYSCLKCTSPNNSLTCSQCAAVDNRILNITTKTC
jgi:hypothetical protein